MLNKKFSCLIVLALAIAIIIPTQISLVNSSAGQIRINRTTASIPNQQVTAGEMVNLYFGDQSIMWSGTQFYLLLSRDLSTTVTSGDYIYSPKLSVSNLQNPNTRTDYSNGEGNWTIGSNWVNGTFAMNMPAGSYSVKAFDFGEAGSETDTGNVAVTDTFIVVQAKSYNATFQITPNSGPGGINAQFSGSGYPQNTAIDVAYYDTVYSEYRAWRTVTTDVTGSFSFNAEIPDLGKSNYQGDNPETYNRLQFKTQRSGLAYCFASYDQYARGLKNVGSQTAYGLYGNGSNLVSTVKAKAGDTFTISGKWFHPSSIYIMLDSEAVEGSVTASQWNNAIQIGNAIANSQGSFNTTVTIPSAINGGEHFISVEDSEGCVIIRILISTGTLQISPSSGPGGANIRFTGSGYPASSSIDIKYRDNQYDSWNYWTTLQADSSGNINLNVEIPDLQNLCYSGDSYNASATVSFRSEVNGLVFSYADYTQNARGLKQVGTKIANYLYGDNTDFANYNYQVSSSNSITISGNFFHPGIIYIRWDGSIAVGTVTPVQWINASIIGTTIANSAGSFETTVTIPSADNGNHWVSIEDSETNLIIKLQVSNSEPQPTPTPTPTPSQNPTPTPTASPTPAPNKQTPTINIQCKSTPIDNGFRVEINGLLSSSGTALADEAVQLYYSKDGGSKWETLTRVNTGGDGKFNAVWISSASGVFMLKAESPASSEYNQATAVVNLAIEATLEGNNEESVFTVTSNSTITQLDFKSETSELSFVASGETGTKGYVTVNIPKTLISDISTLRVYLDNNEVTFTSAQDSDAWVITISYSHSTHKIVMDLSNTQNQSNQQSIPWTIICGGVATAIIAAVAIVTLLKKKQPKAKPDAV